MTRHAAGCRILACAAICAVLSACAGPIGNRVAGAGIDEGGFGNPTVQNTRAMTGAAPALTHLGARFAAEVPNVINFAFDSAALDASARAVLDRQAHFMRRFPEVRFSVYGHTDEVGSAAYNNALGLRRARAAVAYLGQRGVPASRLDALVSYGKSRPVVPTPQPERANRRTVTEVSGFVSGAQMVLDGKYAQLAYRRYVVRVNGASPQSATIAATE